MDLMQVMSATWAKSRAEYGLGDDLFASRAPRLFPYVFCLLP